MSKEGWHTYYVYILTNKNRTVLYTRITNYLPRRLFEHKENVLLGRKTFAARYNCKHLIYYEKFTWVHDAIAREKEIKGWLRIEKLELIKTINPNMEFLDDLFLIE
ncbi:GIY-YIG nuclease family protein [Flagellimonas sp.]|uniref:GIY-YIG nuclease family protein n=1 Tax=Flagellimonas sp. TaxID=2058762 RepID=UPI003B5C0032